MNRDGFVYGDLVSVVVPSYNRAHRLERCLRSLTGQSYHNLEIIVVDDASADTTETVVSGLPDQRIRYLRHEQNRGAAAARNTGILAAQGHIICFQDSDDFSVCHRIETEVRLLTSAGNDVGAVHSARLNYNIVTPDDYGRAGSVIVPRPSGRKLSGDLFLETVRNNFVSVPTMAAWREALIASGLFDERLRNNEDWDFMLRFARVYRVLFCPEPLYLVPTPLGTTENADRIGKTSAYSARSFVRILGKLRRTDLAPALYAHHYRTAAILLLGLGYPRRARPHALRALGDRPLAWKNWILALGLGAPRAYTALRQAWLGNKRRRARTLTARRL